MIVQRVGLRPTSALFGCAHASDFNFVITKNFKGEITMNTSQELLKKNLIQIDADNPDFSELENILNIFNSDQHCDSFCSI